MAESKLESEFFDLLSYALCKAITTVSGKEKAERTFSLVGEVIFTEIKDKLNLEEGKDPLVVVRKIGRYLEKVGYIRKMTIERTGEFEFTYEMREPAIAKGVMKTLSEDFVPPHYSTYIMFAALKNIFNMKAKVSHLKVEKDYAKEKWTLSIDRNPLRNR